MTWTQEQGINYEVDTEILSGVIGFRFWPSDHIAAKMANFHEYEALAFGIKEVKIGLHLALVFFPYL